MNKPMLNLCSLALALTGALGASATMAQTYQVLAVQMETTAAGAINPVSYGCYGINYQSTVMCKETVHNLETRDFQDRVTFDNPFSRPATGRSLPSIQFPNNHNVSLKGLNSSGIAVGGVDSDGAGSGETIMVVANGLALPIQSPFDASTPVEVAAVNEQGWMLLAWNGTGSYVPPLDHTAYLRVPNSDDFSQGTNLPISCSRDAETGLWPTAHPTKVNSNGLIAGSCGNKPVVWGWWDLTASVDLTDALPAMVDLGSGLVPRTDSSFRGCYVVDMADRADVVLIQCYTPVSKDSDQDILTHFVNTPSGASEPSTFRQLPRAISASSPIRWRAVNEQGCAVGASRDASGHNPVHGVLKCPGSNLLFLTFAQDEGYYVRDGVDINSRGDILTEAYRLGANGYYTDGGYMVLSPRR